MDSSDLTTDMSISPYNLVWQALLLIPISHYLLALSFLILIFLYNFVEFHIFENFLSGFRGNRVALSYNPFSEIYNGVVSKCPILHGRYLPTVWLSSPHLQTMFLQFFGRAPNFSYRRQLFHTPDGGTIALDWLMPSDVPQAAPSMSSAIQKDDTTPIVVVIPGLTSDSSSAYLKHLCFKIAKRGWNVVVSNHRGLGGISITSDRFYNAGWTEDLRKVVDYLHKEYPCAPLFAVGTSIGANVLVKYLGEDGDNTYISGAACICSPWDLLIGDRFISRRLVQRFYDKALTIGLQGYAQIHQSLYSRLADWEGIRKARSIRDFDHHATCRVGKFETVDTYYRHCSSASFVRNVSVPLLCISAMDDPLCTREAIPWDECRANKNVVFATTAHGGHLAYFEGITAKSLWWVRATEEFLSVLHSTPFIHTWNKSSTPPPVPESSVDQGPYVNFMEDGMVSVGGDEQACNDMVEVLPDKQNMSVDIEKDEPAEHETEDQDKTNCDNAVGLQDSRREQDSEFHDTAIPARRHLGKLLRQTKISMWLIAYIALITSWPLLKSALLIVFKRKVRNVFTLKQ